MKNTPGTTTATSLITSITMTFCIIFSSSRHHFVKSLQLLQQKSPIVANHHRRNMILQSSTFITKKINHNSKQYLPLQPKQQQQRRSYYRTTIKMMPEGPEVRTLVDRLQPAVGMRLLDIHFLSGRYVNHDKPVGFDDFRRTMSRYDDEMNDLSSLVEVDVIKEWNAKGKFIWIVLDDGRRRRGHSSTNLTHVNDDDNGGDDDDDDDDDFLRSIWITLGMTGRFLNDKRENEDVIKKARWYFEFCDLGNEGNGRRKKRIYYCDRRNFGTVKFCTSRKELRKKLESLGPDILDEDNFDEGLFLEIVEKQSDGMNVCKFLMNQKKLSGVGNYLLAEGLYRANIDPFTTLDKLTLTQKKNLFYHLRDTSRRSYAAQGLTRRNNGSYRTVDGTQGGFVFELQCYGREVCVKGSPVIRDGNGPHGRTIWYVEDQRRSRSTMTMGTGTNTEYDVDDYDNNTPPSSSSSSSSSMPKQPPIDDNHNPPSSTASQRLFAHLTEPSWHDALLSSPLLSSSPTVQTLASVIETERSRYDVYPPPHETFSCLNHCPLSSIKVVIVGQDPYHGPGQAHGLAFSVRRGTKIPPSLRNIFEELMEDVGIPRPIHGCLESWSRQGVLLLNTVLTVRRGEANSHKGRGWEMVTDEIIKMVAERNDHVVFLLWGRPAATKAEKILENDDDDDDDDDDRSSGRRRHVVIKTSHPSPLSAMKTSSPFRGSRCFSRVNDALREMGESDIDWSVR